MKKKDGIGFTGFSVWGNQTPTQSPLILRVLSFGVTEDWGRRRGGGWEREGARERSAHLNSDRVIVFGRSMEIIGNPPEKRSTCGLEGVFVKINLMFTCHFTRIVCELWLVTFTIWMSTSGPKKEKYKLSLDRLILSLNSSVYPITGRLITARKNAKLVCIHSFLCHRFSDYNGNIC